MSDGAHTYDVFVSHSAKDKAVVRPLAGRLRKDGLKVWFDEWGLKPRDSIPAKILVQAVKRNRGRFPDDFMFQLSREEFSHLKSQFVTSSWGGLRRALPYAFTEQGVAMLSRVLGQGCGWRVAAR